MDSSTAQTTVENERRKLGGGGTSAMSQAARGLLDPDRARRGRRDVVRDHLVPVAVELEQRGGVVVLVEDLRYRRLDEVAHLS